jgi:hypothetical protein
VRRFGSNSVLSPQSSILVVSTVCLLAMAPRLTAMVAAPRDFPALVARAEQIVVGTVTAVVEEQDAVGTPWTLVTVSDLTVLKGDVGPTLTLRFYGGTTGDVAVRIPDMPTFTPGERALLFVAGNGRDVCPLVGLWQGRFRLRFDAARDLEVVDDSDHNPVVGRAGRHLARASAGAPTAQPAMTLDALHQVIADELAHPTGPDGSIP